MNPIQWPDRPTCHDGDYHAQHFGQQVWRPKNEKLHPSNDCAMVFRTCSYCGSIHPEDLVDALKAGATLGGSDWKYGWPHKFYVDKIPNPNVGNRVSRESGSRGATTEEERAAIDKPHIDRGHEVEWTNEGGRWSYKVYSPDGPTTHAKWYNEHLKDLSAEAFANLAPLLEQHAGIKFERGDDGRIKYSAPSVGYQV